MNDRLTPPSTAEPPLVGIGLYTPAEAERLTRVPASSIRRWLFGYRYRDGERTRAVEPVWHGEVAPIGDAVALGFRDLIEIRFVHAFRKHGVSWPVIREAARYAQSILDTDHPFASRKFRTDGKRIFAELGARTGERLLIDLARSQYAFHDVVTPSLYEGLEFADDEVVRWFPLGQSRKVVIDPQRAFGRPIVTEAGVPTEVLAKAVEVEKSVERVARWYTVSPREVKAAIEFEQRLAA